MQAVLSKNTTQSSPKASQEIARHHTAGVLAGNYRHQNPHALPTKPSPIHISLQTPNHSRTNHQARHHVHESLLQKAARDAIIKARPTKQATSRTSRHSFPTHLLDRGHDIRTAHNAPSPPSFPRKRESRTGHCQPARASWIPAFAGMTPRAELPARDHVDRYRYLNVRELLGNDNVKTTVIYTHILNRSPAAVPSPVDRLPRERFTPIRIKRRDKSRCRMQLTEGKGIIIALFHELAASCGKTQLRVLWALLATKRIMP